MSEATESEAKRSESIELYIPAAAPTPGLSRVEEFVSDLFDFHGVVPIPTTYGK